MERDGVADQLAAAVDQQKEWQKEKAGGFAMWVWIASTAYLYFMSESATIVSLTGAAFLLIGGFAAALVFGLGIYVTQRSAAAALVRYVGEPKATAETWVPVLGAIIKAAWAVTVFLAAAAVFTWLENAPV
jgi:hypothetical protein